MLIKALCDYYDMLSAAEKVLPEGYSKVKIHYEVALTEEGEIDHIINIQKETEVTVGKKIKKKLVPQDLKMPQRTEKPGIDANIAEHRPLYLFGLNLEKEGLTPTDRTGKAQKSHAAFVETNLKFIEEMEESSKTNQIYLDGYICKEPVYRKTPLGREIADLLLAVNRPYGKSDYIPCICWGRNARYAEHFKVGERCAIWGRIQSREYMKKLDEEHVEKRVAFEVSVSKLELLEEAQVQESIV